MSRFAFVQQGGASNEYYLWVHDTRESAAEHQQSCQEATYVTSDIHRVRPNDADIDALRERVENTIGRDDWRRAEELLREYEV
ncbi:Uncharacterised protein [Mycobacteroides abscessus subsp. abscessus]|nr:Uncharacterised protein [Mycobacteroides abscessus subsp. abscessus]